jgi:hypothetical protein
MRQLLVNLKEALDKRPTASIIPVGIVILGVWTLIRGENVSRAFTDMGGGTLIRACGAAWLIGSVLFVVSVRQRSLSMERVALWFVLLGSTVYGLGALLGLREAGVIAGGTNLLIALAFLGRIRLLKHAQQRLRD